MAKAAFHMNLIFLCPAQKKVMGGVKAIYRLAELAHELLQPMGSNAMVCHPNQPRFRSSWFESTVQHRAARLGWRWVGKPSKSKIKPGTFDAKQDVVVIPELWVRKYGTQLLEQGVPYVILVQGGYLISKGDRPDLSKAYAGAKAVWCVSEDTLNCVVQAFPQAAVHTQRFHLPINAQHFKPALKKKNWITYMPRKMSRHIELIRFFVADKLPPGWEWKPIQNLNETEVAHVLSESKIFLATGELEGFGLPPLEAAFAGNWVIGYHGQGGKEYWHKPIFTEINSGDILGFCAALHQATECYDQWSQQTHQQVEQIKSTYSATVANQDLNRMLLGLIEFR